MTQDLKKFSYLTYIDICGDIDDKTPLIVLQEMIDIHRLDGKLLNNPFILRDKISPFRFNNPLCNEDLPNLARIVNRFCPWPDKDSLIGAFNNMLAFIRTPIAFAGPICYGNATPANPESYNAGMLYKLICLHRLAKSLISKHTTLSQMADIVYIIHNKPELSRGLLLDLVSKMKMEDILKCYMEGVSILNLKSRLNYGTEGCNLPPIVTAWTFDSVDGSFQSLANSEGILKRIKPSTYSDAIALAAKNYRTDISLSQNPIVEYNILNGSGPHGYTPDDKLLRKILDVDPLGLNIDLCFNPALPQIFYKDEILKRMAIAEGYKSSDFTNESAYSLLQSSYYSNTFYHGKHGTMGERTCINYDTVDDLPPQIILCFGQRYDTLYPFTYKELATYFKFCECFKNPIFNDNMLKPIHIRKLKALSQSIYKDDTEPFINERRALFDAITFVEITIDKVWERLRTLRTLYDGGSEEMRTTIFEIVCKLFELSMYMRGWPGEEIDYPIDIVPAIDNPNLVDVRVTNALAELETMNEILRINSAFSKEEDEDDEDDEKDIAICEAFNFMDMPLCTYIDGEYVHSTTKDEGYTIGDRLQIVKAGLAHEDNNSCIRLTSNWLAYTANRLFQVIGAKDAFDVSMLRLIS